MYDVRIVYQDYRPYTVQVDDHELEKFMECVGKGEVFYDKDKSVGFVVPASGIRCALAVKKLTLTKDEPCQNNLPSEAENALPA